jgi:LuxR family maltose regulon positive regulatory protein
MLLERGDVPGATQQVTRALGHITLGPTRSHILYVRMTAARVLQAAGETSAALEQLEAAQGFARGVRQFRFASILSAVRLDVYSRMGDLEAAAEVATERGLASDVEIDYQNEEELTAYARYLVARGDARNAALVLSRVLPVVRAGGRVQHEIRALALQALAYERLGERAHALGSLGRATMLGEPGRFNRTFTGEGPVMTRLLEALADAVRRGRGPTEAGSPPYLSYLLREARVKPAAAAPHSAADALVEPLTGREVEILRLIAAGMRNQEIADHLFISLPTVKRHIANAYGKLGVSHRTEAVARANELNLV